MARYLSRIISVALVPLGLFAFAVVSWADISSFDIKKPTGEISQGEEVQIEWLHSQLLTNKIIIELRGAKKTKGKHSDIFSDDCLKNKGSCTWMVPADIDPGHYRITITSTKNKQNYIKGPVFTIVGDAQESDDKPPKLVEHKRSCTGGSGRVLVPKLKANWAQGSTVMLEWDSDNDGESRDLYLDCNGFEIATGVPDKGFYLWKIPNGVPTGTNKTIWVLPVEDDAAGVTSKKFQLQAWTETERYRGRDQRYDSDLSDRPQVTSPVEGSRYLRGEPLTLRWDDPDHLLLDRVRIELYRHHKAKAVTRWASPNSGVFTLSGDDTQTHWKSCRQKPGCYFVVYSRRHPERRIASGHFLLSKDKKASPEPFALRLLGAGTDPEDDAESLSEVTMGQEVEIRWPPSSAENQSYRTELLKDGLHYLTITDALNSAAGDDNRIEWSLPYTLLPAGGYSISVTGADDAAVFGETPVFQVAEQQQKKKKLQPDKVEDGAWQLKPARTMKRIGWKKPRRVRELRVDLYLDGRRLKTISDSETRPFKHWSVPKTLLSGPGYQIRIQELIEGDTGDQSHFAFSDPFCIYRSDDPEPRDAVCGPGQSGHTTIALTDPERQWCADQNIDDHLKCRPALKSACSTADIPPAECTPAELITHEKHCAIAGIDGSCTAAALEALRAECQSLGIGLVLTPDYDGNTQAELATGAMTAKGEVDILMQILLTRRPTDLPQSNYTQGLKKTLLDKNARKVKIEVLPELAAETDADGPYRFGLRYRIRNSEDQAIEEFLLTHDLNRVFGKGGFEVESVRLVADPSCTQGAVQAETPEEVLESSEPVETAQPASAETICTGAPFDKGPTVLAITAVQSDNEPVQRYFSDHMTSGDRQIIEQIASAKPWSPLSVVREDKRQKFEGRHKLSETLVSGSLLLLKIPVPAEGATENKAVFGRYLDGPDAESVVVDYTKGSVQVAWPQGRVRWLARYATPSPDEDTGALIALERIDTQDDDRKLYQLKPGILRGTLTAVALGDDLSLVEYIDHGKDELLNSVGEVAASVDYETGKIILIKAPNQKAPLYVSYVQQVVDEVLDLNGSATTAENPAVLPANKSLIPGSLRIHIGQLTLADAHYSPELQKMRTSGKRRGASQGKVDYVTGRLDLSLRSPLANGQSINADYLVRIPMASGEINYETGVLNLSGAGDLQGPLDCVDLVSAPPVTAPAELEPVSPEAALAALLVNLFDPDVTLRPEDFEAAGIDLEVTPDNLAEALEAIREAIRIADPTPTTVAQIQAIVDGVIARLAGVSLEVVTYLRNVNAPSRNPGEAQFNHGGRDYYLSGVSGREGDTIEYLVVVLNTNEVAAPSAVLRESPPAFAVYIEGSAERDATGTGSFTALTDQSEGNLGYAAVQVAEGTLTAYLGEDGTVAGTSDEETPGRSMLRYQTRLLIDPLAEVFEDSAGGAANDNDIPVGAAQLEAITGITGVIPANEAAYQKAIAQAGSFDNPATVEQVQEVINTVNTNTGLAEVLEDSSSAGGGANANEVRVSAAQLAAIAGITSVDLAKEAAYQQAILEKMDFGNPPSLEQIQELINTVNAEDN